MTAAAMLQSGGPAVPWPVFAWAAGLGLALVLVLWGGIKHLLIQDRAGLGSTLQEVKGDLREIKADFKAAAVREAALAGRVDALERERSGLLTIPEHRKSLARVHGRLDRTDLILRQHAALIPMAVAPALRNPSDDSDGAEIPPRKA